MKRLGFGALISFFMVQPWLAVLAATPETGNRGTALIFNVRGPIGPATVEYVRNGFQTARAGKAEVIVFAMDTPGGLAKSMRSVIHEILDSPVPVVGFVFPSGSRAASAGTYILYASHIAAMAPGTNLGAATPVKIEGGGLPLPGGEKSPPANPGSIGPGVVGAICLLLGFYALHILPVNYAGLGLLLLAIALMVAEAERNRRAKIINAEGEEQAADKLVAAAKKLAAAPEAMQLRYLSTLYDISDNKGSTIVFPFPIDMAKMLVSKPESRR